jgi:predicted small integral membrane protein
MKVLKMGLVAGMALVLSITTVNNILMPGATYGAIALALGMQTTFKNPVEFARAITSPGALWTVAVIIIICEAIAAVLCWIGAVQLFNGLRGGTARFNQSKSMALIGLTFTAAFYFIGWLVVANEWFAMWQSTKINTLPDAFRIFGEAMLIAMWVNTPDV